MIQIAYIVCWTPFVAERLIYAWSLATPPPPIVPAMLFLLGHTHNLLKGIFYVFDDAQVFMHIRLYLCKFIKIVYFFTTFSWISFKFSKFAYKTESC